MNPMKTQYQVRKMTDQILLMTDKVFLMTDKVLLMTVRKERERGIFAFEKKETSYE